LVESRRFEFTPPLFGAYTLEVTQSEFRRDLWLQKTGALGYGMALFAYV